MPGIVGKISNLFFSLYIFSWDAILTVVNLFLPRRSVGHVVPKGHIGHEGKWGEFIPPKAGDSRSACPALNAMANHGILPRDGKNISFKEMTRTVRATYNFAPTFCLFVPNHLATILNKSYRKDTIELAEINLHNGIEHDASLTREDTALLADQGPPSIPLVEGLLESATGKDKEGNPLLTIADLSRYSGKRRTDARKTNKDYTLAFQHKMFGSSNSSTLLTIFGGRINDIKPFLIEERLPEGWEPRVRRRFGLTIGSFNRTVLRVEFGIKEGKDDDFYKKPTSS
jgi:hypothetical protein